MGLEITNLTGGYTQIPVLHDIEFKVNNGETVGLIGLNGAGKSTTIKHIMGLLSPLEGEITVEDKKIEEDPELYRKNIGYVPESPQLYTELTLKEHIELTIISFELDEEKAWARAEKLLNTYRLEDRLDWFPSYLSKGMQQKVMIICALLIEPALFVIDEPFLGLDPLAIRHLLTDLEEHKKEGAAILMSTHVLSTAEKYCDRFVMLDEGRIVADGTLKEFQKLYGLPDGSLDDIYLKISGEVV